MGLKHGVYHYKTLIFLTNLVSLIVKVFSVLLLAITYCALANGGDCMSYWGSSCRNVILCAIMATCLCCYIFSCDLYPYTPYKFSEMPFTQPWLIGVIGPAWDDRSDGAWWGEGEIE